VGDATAVAAAQATDNAGIVALVIEGYRDRSIAKDLGAFCAVLHDRIAR
jgi:hypothetical protein